MMYMGEEEVELRPHGITINSRGQVIVSETYQSVINIYSPEGKLLKQIGKGGRGISELDLPFYLATNKKDNIIVSDNMNFAVKIFDSEGNFLLKIGSSQEWGQRNFHCPFGICVDERQNILIADGEGQRIAAYSCDGNLLGDVLGKQDQCRNPVGIAINSDGDLLCTENDLDYSNIKLYKSYYDDTF